MGKWILNIVVLGDSIAEGLGVKGRSYPDLICEEISGLIQDKVVLNNFAHTAFQISDSLALLPIVLETNPNIIIIAHGITEAIVRPTPYSLRLVPSRWRQVGWLDPRPFFSQRKIKRLYHLTESSLRWRIKIGLIRGFGGCTWTPNAKFEEQLLETIGIFLHRTSAIVILLTQCGIDERYFPDSSNSLLQYQHTVEKAVAILSDTGRVSICDVSMSLHRWKDFFADHFHPNATGHEKIAQAICNILKTRFLGC